MFMPITAGLVILLYLIVGGSGGLWADLTNTSWGTPPESAKLHHLT
jgi:hypothetical protein